jgi:hypothetical protein
MRLSNIALLCVSTAFVAMPALAQTSGQTNGSSSSTYQGTDANAAHPRQALKQDLEKAGFTNIRVEPEIFVIHATNSQGEPVVMQIGPDSMEAITAIKPNHTTASNSGSSNSNMAVNGQSGTTKD